MKALIIILSTIFTIQVQAAELIAEYEFGFRDREIQNASAQLYTASLADDGYLSLYVKPLAFSGRDQLSELIAVKELHKETFKNLKDSVIQLSNAKVVERFSQIICMIAVPIEQGYDHLSVRRGFDHESAQFKGDLMTVSGPRGCWVGHKIYLEDDSKNKEASTMKSLLRTLTLELSGQD